MKTARLKKRWTKYNTNRKQKNGDIKSFPNNNYIKCKWIKLPNQKKQSGWMDLKNKVQLCTINKELTLDWKTHIDWKWRVAKR